MYSETHYFINWTISIVLRKLVVLNKIAGQVDRIG